jgi:hypothetical protein
MSNRRFIQDPYQEELDEAWYQLQIAIAVFVYCLEGVWHLVRGGERYST